MGRKVFVIGVGMTKFEKPGIEGLGLPGHGQGGRQQGARRTPASPTTTSSRRPSATATATRPAASAPSTSSASPASRSTTSTTTARPARRRCSWPSSSSRAASPTARSRSASRRWRRARSGVKYTDRTNPMDKHFKLMVELRGFAAGAGRAADVRQRRPRAHGDATAPTPEHFARIGWKNHKHSVNNPYSQFQDEYTLEEILDAPMVYEPLTKLQCCPTSDGAGAAILASEDFVAQARASRPRRSRSPAWRWPPTSPSTFDEKSCIKIVGYDMIEGGGAARSTSRPASAPRTSTSSSCTTASRANELITYEALGLCPEGKARRARRLRRRTPTAARWSSTRRAA